LWRKRKESMTQKEKVKKGEREGLWKPKQEKV
jgi:hypothetical protein